MCRSDDKRYGFYYLTKGFKLDCNGVDNALLAFDHVRIPAENILNKYSDVDSNGNFVSKIGSRRARFVTVAGFLFLIKINSCVADSASVQCVWVAQRLY